MKHIVVSAALLLLTTSVYGQTASAQPCTLKLSQAPAVRGLKLDMTLDELFEQFPGLAERVGRLAGSNAFPNFGYSSFNISPSDYSTKDRFSGINGIHIGAFDRRIVSLDVDYMAFPAGARWRNTGDLVQRFAESLHLPNSKDWTADENVPRRRINCEGFEILIDNVNDSAHIRFATPKSWAQTQKDRFAAFEEQKRREFKP